MFYYLSKFKVFAPPPLIQATHGFGASDFCKKEELQREQGVDSREQASSQMGQMWRIEGTQRRIGGNMRPATWNLSGNGPPIRLVPSAFSTDG